MPARCLAILASLTACAAQEPQMAVRPHHAVFDPMEAAYERATERAVWRVADPEATAPTIARLRALQSAADAAMTDYRRRHRAGAAQEAVQALGNYAGGE